MLELITLQHKKSSHYKFYYVFNKTTYIYNTSDLHTQPNRKIVVKIISHEKYFPEIYI